MMFVIFIKQNCKYSQRALSLIKTVTNDYEVFDMTGVQPHLYEQQMEYYGKPKEIRHYTYPAIFGYDEHFNIEFFGGSDELMAYIESKNDDVMRED